jgi:hypothetical protein
MRFAIPALFRASFTAAQTTFVVMGTSARDGETGGGCGSEDLGILRGTVELIRPEGHRFDGEPVVLSGTR